MKIPEHVAFSLLVAQLGLQPNYGNWGAALAVVAGCLPDLDGMTLLASWDSYRAHHRTLFHNLPAALVGPLALAVFASVVLSLERFVLLWAWLLILFLGHLVTDVLFYRWPVQLLWPLSRRGWGCGLVAWNDLVPTLLLYGGLAVVLTLPAHAAFFSGAILASLAIYLLGRAFSFPARDGWTAWVMGDWAKRAPRVCRWLTGDFVT